MSDSDIATDLMIRPSPGVRGAIKCGICNNPDMKVFIKPGDVIKVVIFCPLCGNRMEFSHGNDGSR